MDAAHRACEVYTFLQQWSSLVKAHSDTELLDIQRLAKAVKRLLDAKLRNLIMEVGHKALLQSYTGDSTPVQTRVQFCR